MLFPDRPFAHPFYWPIQRRDSNSPASTTTFRDMGACYEVLGSFTDRGIARMGEPILNMPPRFVPPEPVTLRERLKLNLSFVAATGLILALTRPPISDPKHADRKKIEWGLTDLEWQILEAFEEYLSVSARSHTKLTARAAAMLPETHRNHRDLTFSQKPRARCLSFSQGHGRRTTAKGSWTGAFILRREELWQDGPGFLGIFSMDAISTLAWAWLLRHRFPFLLDEPGFSYFKLHTKALPERPTNNLWANDWHAEPVIVHSRPAVVQHDEVFRPEFMSL